MANTERLIALQKVREAKKVIDEARSEEGLAKPQKKLLEELFVELDSLEDILILEAIEERIDALRAAGSNLEKITKKISKNIEKLKKVAEVVDKAAKAIKILADIAANVGKLGLI